MGHKIFKVEEIICELEDCIINNKPFSLIRLGDGGLKFIHSILFNNTKQMNEISLKEGIPINHFIDIMDLWGKYTRRANFIDSCDVYFSKKFWPRLRNERISATRQTIYKMKRWDELYYNAEIENNRFCNPEVNYLSCIGSKNPNLISVIKDRSICFISTYSKEFLNEKIDICKNIDNIKIVGQYGNQYKNNYSNVIEILKNKSKEFDLFLVAAGELGRIYSGIIKENGGRAFDIGFMIDYWCGKKSLHPRLKKFVSNYSDSKLELELTNEGLKYDSFI